MGGYVGTGEQQRQQAKSDRLTPWIMQTPGACLTGRLMCSDDPDRLGWDVVREHLEEDKAFAFRFLDAEGRAKIEAFAAEIGAAVFGWNGFSAEAGALDAAIRPITATPLDDGFALERAEGRTLKEMQAALMGQGIAPISSAVLGGQICDALSLLIRDAPGNIVAMGFAGMLQNRFSPWADYGWVGAIATDPAQRGKGLGKRITAELIRRSLDELGAKHIMGFAAADNPASAAMLQRCGMKPGDRASYVVSLTQKPYTR